MLSEHHKEEIRNAYNAIVESKSLAPRWGQRQMIAEIANTLSRIAEPDCAEPAVCVIEAGTGTGKTIAYAVAAIPLAKAFDKRLVVATATVALQEQFIHKDLPDIQQSSGLAFTYALAKGRRRYVCLSKLDRMVTENTDQDQLLPLYIPEADGGGEENAAEVYGEMIDALGRGEWDGDRDNWAESISEQTWYGVTTDHSQCSGRRCPNISQCSFFRAREELQNADIIVTNHDLVLSDLALGGGAILSAPEDSIYIFDEGHHLPDKALSHFASFCRLHTTIAWLQDSNKFLSETAQSMQNVDGADSHLTALPGDIGETIAALQVTEQAVAALFDAVEPDARQEQPVLRFEHGRIPDELAASASALAGLFDKLTMRFGRLESLLESALEEDISGIDKALVETWHINVGGMLGRAEGALALWRDYAAATSADGTPVARWITLLNSGSQYGFELRSSPVLAAEILSEHLWARAAGVVVTSATITALGSFERFILHSGAPRAGNFKMVASPFDYASASFTVPLMNCEPQDAEAHTEELVRLLPELLDSGEGSLVLFSSRRQMLEVYNGLQGVLSSDILMQGDYSKQEILRRHRAAIDDAQGSVIFGLASFAEGVDLPGDYCRHVVIAKIPFAVPDSPLEASLAEWFETQGRNPFMEISVPDAALRLVQASGRLLRTETDTGRVTLLDRRVITRRYGRAILDSLPPFRIELAS